MAKKENKKTLVAAHRQCNEHNQRNADDIAVWLNSLGDDSEKYGYTSKTNLEVRRNWVNGCSLITWKKEINS